MPASVTRNQGPCPHTNVLLEVEIDTKKQINIITAGCD